MPRMFRHPHNRKSGPGRIRSCWDRTYPRINNLQRWASGRGLPKQHSCSNYYLVPRGFSIAHPRNPDDKQCRVGHPTARHHVLDSCGSRRWRRVTAWSSISVSNPIIAGSDIVCSWRLAGCCHRISVPWADTGCAYNRLYRYNNNRNARKETQEV